MEHVSSGKAKSNTMRMLYITSGRLPTEKAHGYQIVKMCEMFASLGIDVKLVSPKRRNDITEDVYSFYDIPRTFSHALVSFLDFSRTLPFLRQVGFFLNSVSFLLRLLFFPIPKGRVIYTRDIFVSFLYTRVLKKKVIFECHNIPQKRIFFRLCVAKCAMIVCNSRGTKEALISILLHPSIHAAPNGYDPETFDRVAGHNRQDVRRELNLPLEKFLVVYTGHLYAWKGIDTVVEAAAECADPNIRFVIVGGTQKDVRVYRERVRIQKIQNITFLGHKPKKDIPSYLMAADALLLPNSAKTTESVLYTSPIKLFEYMAAGIPVIASDMPSIRSVLSSENAFFFSPDDRNSLLQKIFYVRDHKEESGKKALQATRDVSPYTWRNRAEKISHYINSIV